MKHKLVRFVCIIGALLILSMVAACGWFIVPHRQVASNCPPITVQTKVFKSAQGNGTFVEVTADTATIQMAVAQIERYSIYGSTPTTSHIADKHPLLMAVLYTQVLNYTVTNQCGSSQQGMVFIWK